jgi:hypothetical protein
VRVLRPIVEIPVLAVLDFRENLPLRRTVAFEFIGDDHPRDVLAPFEELAEELLRGVLVAPPLHQNIEHHAILIHRPPQIVSLLADCDEYLIQVPFIA